MKTVEFRNGDKCPQLGLGTFKAESGTVYNAVKNAIELGYRHIDCAPVYGNQSEIGTALIESGIPREELWITSKLWNDSHDPKDVQPAIEATLAELKLDYLDLYLIHWPVALRKGLFLPSKAEDLIPLECMPLQDTWQAMEGLVEKGLCRHIGVSNFSSTKLKLLLDTAKRKPEVNQVEFHPYLQQPELLSFCQREQIFLTAYSPLGSPDRPARLREDSEPVLLQDSVILEIAKSHGTTPAQILLAWALQRGVIAIPKTTSVNRLKENLEAGTIQLSKEEIEKIGGLDRQRRYYSGNAWIFPGGCYSLANLWDE